MNCSSRPEITQKHNVTNYVSIYSIQIYCDCVRDSMLCIYWYITTMNCSSRRPHIASLWLIKHIFRPHWTMWLTKYCSTKESMDCGSSCRPIEDLTGPIRNIARLEQFNEHHCAAILYHYIYTYHVLPLGEHNERIKKSIWESFWSLRDEWEP